MSLSPCYLGRLGQEGGSLSLGISEQPRQGRDNAFTSKTDYGPKGVCLACVKSWVLSILSVQGIGGGRKGVGLTTLELEMSNIKLFVTWHQSRPSFS